MLRPRLMKHVRLLVLTEDLPQASLALAQTQCFHPDTRPPAEAQLCGLPGRDYRDTYNRARSRLDKIVKLVCENRVRSRLDRIVKLVCVAGEASLGTVRAIEYRELAELDDWLGQIWEKASRFEEDLRQLDDAARMIREQEAALANFQDLDIDLGMLRNKTRFLDFYVGIVPRVNLRQLEGAVGLADHLLHVYMLRGDQAHVVIVGPTGTTEAQLSAVLNAAGFQALPIPEGLDREPERMRQALDAQRSDIEERRRQVQARIDEWSGGFRGRLLEARRTLMLAEPLVVLEPSLRSAGHLAYLAGWVPSRSVEGLQARLRQSLALPFDLLARDPRPDERRLVPTVPVKSRLLAPFAMLVKQYGIPEYGEVDPTPLFALTFLLMFGSMFGDVGQGAVIAAVAWILRGRLGRFWLFGLMAGLASVCFGLLYGSVFGYEGVLPALWMSPLHDPILMLKIALGYGVVFLAVACLLAIYNRIAVRNWWGAVFGHHGIVNLVFYLSLVWGGLRLAQSGSFGSAPAALVALALSVLAGYAWLHLEAPLGEKILVVFIETLETVIGYVSNTLSFLRVAAFSLNHVALSIAVFTLANMMGSFGHVVTVILGNVFVLVLEGGIVMIQVMRLQYYEGFSRYFSGEGHEFVPIRLGRGSAAP